MTKSNARQIAISRVAKTLAHFEASKSLPVQLEDGRTPVVVALPDDTIGEVQAQISLYGSANVVVAYEDKMALIAFQRSVMSGKSDSTVRVNPSSNIDMLVQLLQANAGLGLHISIVDAGHTEPASELAEIEYAAA